MSTRGSAIASPSRTVSPWAATQPVRPVPSATRRIVRIRVGDAHEGALEADRLAHPAVVVDPVDADRVVVDERPASRRRSPGRCRRGPGGGSAGRPAPRSPGGGRSSSASIRPAGRCRSRSPSGRRRLGRARSRRASRRSRSGGRGRADRAARRGTRSGRSRWCGPRRAGRSSEAPAGSRRGRRSRTLTSCSRSASIPSVLASRGRVLTRSRISSDRPRCATARSGFGASSYIHSPAWSTPNSVNASSMTSRNRPSRSWRPLTSAAILRSASARVGRSPLDVGGDSSPVVRCGSAIAGARASMDLRPSGVTGRSTHGTGRARERR